MILDGRKVVTTAGTSVFLFAVPTAVKTITVQAETDNTGIIAVGTTPVAALGAQKGAQLPAGASVSFSVDPTDNTKFDAALIKIDATVSGDGVSLSYEV